MRNLKLVLLLLILNVISAPLLQGSCKKSITFAVAANGSLNYRLPNVSPKWFSKAQEKFPNICFSQMSQHPEIAGEHYLIVLSMERSAFNGLYPVYRTTTETTTNPTSGTGTITDNTGSTWNYTYNGTLSTTTTTTSQNNLPYTDTTVGLYAIAYDEHGVQIGSAERSETSRQGGDAANSVGYNLGARLMSIHIKEHLLNEIVSRVNMAPPKPSVNATDVASVSHTSQPMLPQTTVSAFDSLTIGAATGINNLYSLAKVRSVILPHIETNATDASVKCIVDSGSSACFDNWPLSQKSFSWMLELESAIRGARSTNDTVVNAAADELKPTWAGMREVYCRQNHGASYTDLEGSIASCP